MIMVVNHLPQIIMCDEFDEFVKSPDLVKAVMRRQFVQGIVVGQTVSELRKRLVDKGLDVDGSRGTLLKRLEQAEEGK